jgi:hypothetical protein
VTPSPEDKQASYASLREYIEIPLTAQYPPLKPGNWSLSSTTTKYPGMNVELATDSARDRLPLSDFGIDAATATHGPTNSVSMFPAPEPGPDCDAEDPPPTGADGTGTGTNTVGG